MEILKRKYNFIVSGDSISKGVVFNEEKGKYTMLQENYVSIIGDKINGTITNLSKFGATITKGVEKLRNRFFDDKADIVLLEYGGNDCDFNWEAIAADPYREHLPNTDFNFFEKTLKETISLITKGGAVPVLLTLPPLDADSYFKWVSRNDPQMASNILKWLGSVTKIYWWQERYNSLIIKIAEETSTRWIDIRGAFLQNADFSKFLCIDGIHPNKDGHILIAQKIMDYITPKYSFLLT